MRRSDHWPFIQRGVPGVWVHTGLHPDYHTPYDRPEKINYPKMEKIARMVYQTAWDLANAAAGHDSERWERRRRNRISLDETNNLLGARATCRCQCRAPCPCDVPVRRDDLTSRGRTEVGMGHVAPVSAHRHTARGTGTGSRRVLDTSGLAAGSRVRALRALQIRRFAPAGLGRAASPGAFIRENVTFSRA